MMELQYLKTQELIVLLQIQLLDTLSLDGKSSALFQPLIQIHPQQHVILMEIV